MNLSKGVLQAMLALADIRINAEHPRPWDISVKDAGWIWPTLAGGRSIPICDAFVHGEWDCQDPAAFFGKLIACKMGDRVPDVHALWMKVRAHFRDQQSPTLAKRVAKQHYDFPPEFYHLMLGADPMIYTSATPELGDDLPTAQARKLDKIGRKAALEPGMNVLDIGAGWGGTLAYLAEHFGIRGVGVSNSAGHVNYAKETYRGSNALEFRQCDYREITGRFQRVISVEMIEAVGVRHFPVFFGKVAEVLEPGGRFFLQAIWCFDRLHACNEWVERHIFPGGELGTKPQMTEAAARAGLKLVGEEDFPDGYVWTLRQWTENLLRNADTVVNNFGARTLRTFLCYLALCEAGFAERRTSVSQLVFVRA